ncbi:MAG: GAF domain-containing protein [Anaerolineae bacterium]|nr:GAF domain-containing protein [Anaerolineae bacterium]
MWHSLLRWFSLPTMPVHITGEGEPERTHNARLLNAFLLLSLVAVLVYTLGSIIVGDGVTVGVSMGLGTFTVLAFVALVLLRQGYVKAVGVFVVLLMWSFCTYLVLRFGGIHDEAVPGFFLVTAAAGLILGCRGVLGFSVLGGVALVLAYYLERAGRLNTTDLLPSDPRDLVAVLVLLGLMGFFVQYAVRRLQAMAALAQQNVDAFSGAKRALKASQDALNRERERLLGKLQASMSVVQAATAAVDTTAAAVDTTAAAADVTASVPAAPVGERAGEEVASSGQGPWQHLFDRVAAAIASEFGCDYVAIFWIDQAAGVVTRRAVSGSAATGHHAPAHIIALRIAEGLAGLVAADGEPRLAGDVTLDPDFVAAPELPNARSEMAVPIVFRGEIAGVLDVQSTRLHAFDEEDRVVLQALMAHLSQAIDNAQLLQDLRTELRAAEQAYQDIVRADWRRLLRDERGLGYVSTGQTTLAVNTTAATDRAQLDLTAPGYEMTETAARSMVRVPVELAGQVIAEIQAHLPPEAGGWTEERMAMLETLSAQLSQAMERARLYRETQRRATRERVLREISDEMGRASDLSSLMRITVDALNRSLGGSRLYVRLVSEEDTHAVARDGSGSEGVTSNGR